MEVCGDDDVVVDFVRHVDVGEWESDTHVIRPEMRESIGGTHVETRRMTTSSTNNSVFRGYFEKQKLTGPNFINWYRQLMIVLSIEDKLNYLEQPVPPAPVAPAGQHVAPEILAAHNAWIKGSKEIAGLMLMTMEPEIQRNLEPLHAHEMLQELKTLFAQQAEQELLQTTRDFHSYRQEEGQLVSSYVLKMKGYIDNLKRLGHPVTLGLSTVNELHAMLKLHEQTLPKSDAPALHAIRVSKYLAELMKKKKNAASGAGGSGIFVIEVNTILNRSLIYDTGCGTHICNTTQSLRASRKLKPRAFTLYMGNGQCEAVEVIGTFYLCLPSGLEIVLNNCHYAPSITRGVIYVSRLYEDDFVNRFVDNTIQVSRNNVVYFSAIPRDGIFEIDFKKLIEKLQHDGLLDSSNLRAFKKYVSCMSGKMARKPYTHQAERAKDLLGLIHTDVCGPFKIMSRQGASYFVTLTNDFSHYGYVYLLKHKHEVFETFKVFQKEVENQLGKTIKSLLSDHRGEYMSQEFLDHLKDQEIIAHRTPSYTTFEKVLGISMPNEALGNSGGILCVWEENVFKKDYAMISDNFVAIYRTCLPSNSKILFVAIYAPQQASCKRVLWEYVSTLIGRWNGETIILGDFNEVRSIDERHGSCFNPSSARVFDHFISSSGLVDVKLEGLEGFDAMVAQTWCSFSHSDVNRMIRFKKKLQDLKAIIRCWVKDKRMHRSGEKNSIKNVLSDIDKEVDRGVVSDTNLFRRLELQRKLHDINQMKAKDSFQKSKIKWAIEGGENSKFFHGIINKKRSQLAIRGVFDNGLLCTNPGKVKEAFFNHFEARFKKPVAHRFMLNFPFNKWFSDMQAADLARNVSRDEIRLAV
nr:zinc finger, CCHC-type [Tanacetum cinerariifolium]